MIRQAMSQVRENMTGMKWDTKACGVPPSSLLRMYTCEREREHGVKPGLAGSTDPPQCLPIT